LVAAGAAVNAAALAGWVLAKTRGIGFVDGLDTREDVQFADALAAGLAALAVAGAVVALAGRLSWAARPRPGLVAAAGVATVALVVPGMVATTGHAHPGGHGDEPAAHDHGGGADDAGDHAHGGGADDAG